jgi:hypothetical protein
MYQKYDIVYFYQMSRGNGIGKELRVERAADFHCHIFHSKVEWKRFHFDLFLTILGNQGESNEDWGIFKKTSGNAGCSAFLSGKGSTSGP